MSKNKSQAPAQPPVITLSPEAAAPEAAAPEAAAPEAAAPEAAAPDAGAPDAAAVVEYAKPAETVMLRAVHGVMIHPFSSLSFSTDSITEVSEIDPWTQSQIDAHKLVIA